MSFNPEVSHGFAEHAPEVLRGLVVSEEDEAGFWGRMKGGLKRIGSLARARPDFLAYDIRSLPAPLPQRLRAAGMPVLTWTVRRSEEHTSELQSLMRNSYAVFCLKKKKKINQRMR